MTDRVQAKAGELALTAHLRVGQPDRRHEVTKRELGQYARVDLVGLARQRREALHALRISDQDVPALRLERVMHEPRAVHRLNDGTHPARVFRADTLGQAAQAVLIEWCGQLVDELALIRDQADIDALATEI